MKGATITLRFIIVIIVLATEKVSAKAVCNSDKDTLPKRYDPLTHECKNGTIRVRPSLGPMRHEIKTAPTRQEVTKDRTRYETTTSRTRVTKRVPKPAPAKCGYGEYTPRTQTCCVQMIYNYKIHEGAHSTHICCELKAFPRGFKDLPCKHPSMNDPLFKPTYLKRYGKTNTFCSDGRFRFSLELKQKYTSHVFPHYNATLTPLDSPNAASKHVKVAIDTFSPRKSLDGKTLLIISTHNHSKDQTFDLYLRTSDEVYTGTCNARTLLKRLIKEKRRKCKTRNQRRNLI